MAKKTIIALLLIPAVALLLSGCAYVNTKTPYEIKKTLFGGGLKFKAEK